MVYWGSEGWWGGRDLVCDRGWHNLELYKNFTFATIHHV